MFDFLKRQKLQRKGYSCGKKRREQNTSEWVEALRCSPYIRGFVIATFLCGIALLVRSQETATAFRALGSGMGMAVIVTILFAAVTHLRISVGEDYSSNSRFLLVFTCIFLQLLLLQSVQFVLGINKAPEDFILFVAPMALAPMLLTLLLGKRRGFFAVLYSSLFGCLLTNADIALPFALLSTIVGIVSVGATSHVRKRGQLMRAGLYSGLAGIVVCTLIGRMEPVWLNVTLAAAWKQLAMQAPSMLVAGLFTATIVGGLLPMMEAIFRITTTVSWIELADLNHPVLRRMTLEAPGTWHHSLMVANLAETAAEAVGANPTICRVCSYFHDIGKLTKPEYFIENISGDENPHDDLTPTMSALIIASHVKDGVDLALKHKLNHEIIDVIQQHHGNSLIYYFYHRAQTQKEEIKKLVAEGKAPTEDIPEVSESSFRYPGPKPDFKESAIISMADAVESASRTLSKPTPAKIEQLVDDIIRARIRDGQLDDCDLTLNDLSLIRESFTKTLRTALHRRIPYPAEKSKEKPRDKETKPVAEKDDDDDDKRPPREDPPTRTERRETFERPRQPRTLPAAASTPVLLPPPDASPSS